MVAPLLWELRFLIAAGAAVSLLLLRGDTGEVCFSGRFVSFGLLLWVGLSSFSAIGGRWIVPAVSFDSGLPVATTVDFVPVVSLLVDGGGRRGWGMLFVSAVGLASSGGLVSFYFRVGGSVAGCGASFRSPVSVMADLLGVFLFLRWQKEEDERHKKEGVSPLRLQECWPPFSRLLFSSFLRGVCLCTPSICLCGLLFEASYRSEVENLDYTRLLEDQVVFQRACNLMITHL
ncbi:hypothetical protein PVAP13_3KG437101 [Panicum virgatum]|uniref:Uncharacterized protein n=1 Tax=Panicum virgatum TaxID=38727 RepID=A0A8T0V6W5_PANVG|nr:hypothetical protein PVAP13_3KG437101 [Panicum virgatum]